MLIVTCVVLAHDIRFVLLAALICVVGSTATISLVRRALDTPDATRIGWLFLSSVCAGASIWATHFVAMLGYQPDTSVSFDPILTIASIVVAIFGAGLGFAIALLVPSRTRTIFAGGILGIAIAAMHYLGMFGYRVQGMVAWRLDMIVVSVVLSVLFAVAAIHCLHRFRQGPRRYIAVACLVAAIVGLHFSGMAAFQVSPIAGLDDGFSEGAMQAMAIAVALVGMIVIGTGITSYLIDDCLRLLSNAQLFELAFHDPLTGLWNRRALTDRMDEAFAAKTWFKLLLIDLDHFKTVNDTYGHATGDSLLVEVAVRLREVIGNDAIAYRMGGDELAILVFKDRETALQIASNIVAAMKRPITANGYAIVTGCSIGLCAFENAADGETLMQRADLALYEAKQRGRGQVFRYAVGMLEAAAERSRLEADLKAALAERQFELHYQPIVDIETDITMGYEALIRWWHPVRGQIPPSDFIPLAEENGCIVPLGKWVIEEACRAALRMPPHLYVAVNVSPVQFKSTALLADLTRALAETGLPAHRLEIELTETAMVADRAEVAHTLQALRILGVRVAMDDFGTGFSSLTHLKDLPLDRIKIDRSFVASAQNDPKSMAVLKAITQLGRDMGISTLGEGVETLEQLQILRDVGCDAAQGYLLGRPAPLTLKEAIAA